MNAVDIRAIRKAMEPASELPWVEGRRDAIVTRGRSPRRRDDEEICFYGGRLVAESIVPDDKYLICLVMWHLPALLELAEKALKVEGALRPGGEALAQEVPF